MRPLASLDPLIRRSLLELTCCVFFASPAWAVGQSQRTLSRPARPLPVSAEQYAALQDLSKRPEHAAVATARASYSPEVARTMTEFGVQATQIGIPTAILITLIAAAPL